MHIEFDPAKSERNIRERGLSFIQAAEFDFETATYVVDNRSFIQAAEFDFETATYVVDNRRDYGEVRIRALGYLSARLHALVFVGISDGIRVISFRKANQREVELYESQT